MLRFHFAHTADTSTQLHLRGHRIPRNGHAIKIAAMSHAYLAEYATVEPKTIPIRHGHRTNGLPKDRFQAAAAAAARREQKIAAAMRQREE